jgi:membrane-associated protease RseP (regulator of RpoE activity)
LPLSSSDPFAPRGDLPPVTYESPELPRAVPGPAPPRDRVWLHALLLFLTFVTTSLVGASTYIGFISDLGLRRMTIPAMQALTNGLWYSVTALTILGAHEMGHYVACRYYRIDASLPYFIPAPWLSLFGTLGAVIRIREPIRTKRMLFDIGVAGPIAGFVVAVPALLLGMSWSRLIRLPPHIPGVELINLGEPLLFQMVKRLFFGVMPAGVDVNMHPMVLAAWLGMLATALNLLPLGQLDGGHIAYANLGRRANVVTYVTLAIMFVLGVVVSVNWLFWSGLMLVMLFLFGWRHPPTSDEHDALGTGRLLLTLFAVLMFVLCFTPAPITPSELIGR